MGSWSYGMHRSLSLFGGAAAQTFIQQITALGPLAYWPLSDLSGLVADNAVGLAARDGAYSAAGVTLNNSTMGSTPVPAFNGSTGYVDIYTASLAAAFNGGVGSLMVMAQFDNVSRWTDAGIYGMVGLRVDATNLIRLWKNGNNTVQLQYAAQGVAIKSVQQTGLTTTGIMHFVLTWDKPTTNQLIGYYQSVPIGSPTATIGTWAGSLDSTRCTIAAISKTPLNPWPGRIGHAAVWDRVLSPQEVAITYPFDVHGLFCLGDSKTKGDDWPGLVAAGIETATGQDWKTRPMPYAEGGQGIAYLKGLMDSDLPGEWGTAHTIIINIGVNDIDVVQPGLPVEADWKADYIYVINALRAKYSGVPIYLAKVWKRDFDSECDTLDGWIDDIIALYPSGVSVGIDERVVLENGDNGTTYTDDGIHPNAAAQPVVAAAWLAALGY